MPNAKKPGFLAWVLYAIAVVAGLAVISSLYQALKGAPAPFRTEQGVRGVAVSSMALPDIAPGVPEDMMMGKAIAPEGMLPPAPGGSTNRDLEGNVPEPKVIRNGSLDLRVEDAPKAMDDARKIASDAKGFVESSSLGDAGVGPRTGYMTLRIPATAFDDVFGKLKAVAAVVLNESTNAQDITSQFVDLDARLKNARAEEQSYVAILDRAGSIKDVLDVTRQLADVRGRIEQMQAEMRYMENQTELATIRLTLTEETRVEAPTRTWKPGEIVRQAFQDLVLALQGFVNFLIRFMVALIGLLVPVAAFVALLIWVGWKLVKAVLKRLK